MKNIELIANIKSKRSFLCLGLDTDISKIPSHLKKFNDPIFEFNKEIVDATYDITVAIKPNLAFYESAGIQGLTSLAKTIDYIKAKYPDIYLIADAKRGDIGNTSKMYADAAFREMNFDAVTVSPYMGRDSVLPFLEDKNKHVILLALTSNEGAQDFQFLKLENGKMVYQEVIDISKKWATPENLMYVVGATKAESLVEIRKQIPDYFLLVPGVGAQGGSLEDVCKYGMNSNCGLLVNSSRGIIYASSEIDFAQRARAEALKLQCAMDVQLTLKGL